MQDLGNRSDRLFYATAPLAGPVRLAGSALLDLHLVDGQDHGQLAPTLVDIAEDGSATPIARGFLNLQYRNGLAKAEPLSPGEPVRARARFAPQDQTVAAGHRIGVIVQSSNVGWAVPDQGGPYEIAVLSGAQSRLILPVVGEPGVPGIGGEHAPLPDAQPAAPFGPQEPTAASSRTVAPRTLTVIAHRRGRLLVVSGVAPRGKRVTIRVTQSRARALVKRVRATGGRYRAYLRLRGRGRVRVTVSTRQGTRVVRARRVLR